MNCFVCKGELTEKKVNYMVDLESTIIIIKEVPAKVCSQCGEQYFEDETSENIETIVNKLKDLSFSWSELERKKKVLISNEIFSYENIEMVNDMIIDNILFDNRIETDIIDIIDSLNIDELNEVFSKIDFNKKGIVILKK